MIQYKHQREARIPQYGRKKIRGGRKYGTADKGEN